MSTKPKQCMSHNLSGITIYLEGKSMWLINFVKHKLCRKRTTNQKVPVNLYSESKEKL